MSLHTTASGDMLRSTCRPRRPGGATLLSIHVAWHTGARRRARASVSPFTSSSSDMQRVRCRASCGSGATCSRWYVAPHGPEGWHGSGCRIARPLRQGDIHPIACRPAHVSGATCRGHPSDEHEKVCGTTFASRSSAPPLTHVSCARRRLWGPPASSGRPVSEASSPLAV